MLEHTPQAGVLQRIYRGSWCDYVQCKSCMHQSSTTSSFDDINLSIRAFDEHQTPFTSLDAALSAFLEPETLEGDNAYHCEKCACKRPALKGTRLVTLPPILCVASSALTSTSPPSPASTFITRWQYPPCLTWRPF